MQHASTLKPATRVLIASLLQRAMVLALLAPWPAVAQDVKPPDASMASIEPYLMDRSAEIALARSAAPTSISHDAKVLLLGRRGFETAVEGTNGFVCLVERSWTSAPDADFWNPRVRTPICYNATAAHSILLRNIERTDLVLAGRTKAETDEAIVAAVEKKDLPVIEAGAMCYMMSKEGYGGDSIAHWPSHLMFYFPHAEPAAWGGNLPGSPVVAMRDDREHLTEFVVEVQRWSDGTERRLARKSHVH
jgi:hypothetical protein